MEESSRKAASAPHVVEYFHDVTDPYSHLTAQVLDALVGRYDIRLDVHLVSPPPDWAAPERARLEAYSRLDAARLAAKAGLSFADPGRQPDPSQAQRAAAIMSRAIDAGQFTSVASPAGSSFWRSDLKDETDGAGTLTARLENGSARRDGLGHYLGATFHNAGEWYWGIDRLHYLEARLAGLGARRAGAPSVPIFAPPPVPSGRAARPASPAPELHYYLSFRSPYTYIAAARVRELAQAYGADLKLRFVLPMVMRGLPVPRMKSRYITHDTAREARRLGIAFGRICDPVGQPVERGYAILPWARAQGRGFEFCHAFLEGVWSKGVDAGTDDGLARIVDAAGLDWAAARRELANDAWRAEAEANRAEMLALGLWGVPSLRVGAVAAWGQDRLWLIEDELSRLSA